MVVILLGAPGVGKGTQAARLAESNGAEHVSTGDLLRTARREGTELGRKAQRYMDAGELVPDDLILSLVREHLGELPEGADVLLDGFPRTIAQAQGLDGVLVLGTRAGSPAARASMPLERHTCRNACPWGVSSVIPSTSWTYWWAISCLRTSTTTPQG